MVCSGARFGDSLHLKAQALRVEAEGRAKEAEEAAAMG